VTKDTKQKDHFIGKCDPPLPGIVILNNNHNHHTDVCDSMQYLRGDSHLRKKFENYFADMTPDQAMRLHEEKLSLKEDGEILKADGHYNPRPNTVYWWHKEWRKKNFGPPQDPLSTLQAKCKEYEDNGQYIENYYLPTYFCGTDVNVISLLKGHLWCSLRFTLRACRQIDAESASHNRLLNMLAEKDKFDVTVFAVNKTINGEFFSGTTVVVSEESPWCVLLCTPLMQRAQKLPSAKEIIFVDSTGTVDASHSNVTVISTATKIGAVPLCILMHENQTTVGYIKAFRMFKDTFPNAFGGETVSSKLDLFLTATSKTS